MKYAVNIAREFGENTIKALFINRFDDEEKWNDSIQTLSQALELCELEVECSIIEREEWKIAHIIFREVK